MNVDVLLNIVIYTEALIAGVRAIGIVASFFLGIGQGVMYVTGRFGENEPHQADAVAQVQDDIMRRPQSRCPRLDRK
jgi:hypothetical protein